MGDQTEDLKSAATVDAEDPLEDNQKIHFDNESEDEIERRVRRWVSIFFGFLLLGVLGFIIWTGFGVGPILGSVRIFNKPEIRLTAMMISGVLVLLISMGFLAWIYSMIGKNDPNEALGLPKGSVRAIVALLLIVLFAILAVFYFNQLNDDLVVTTERVTQTGLTAAQKDQLLSELPPQEILSVRSYEEVQIVPNPDYQEENEITSAAPITSSNSITGTPPINQMSGDELTSIPPEYKAEFITHYEVVRVLKIEGPNPESQRYAQQILTTIGTLVVAVAGFYYGTRAVAQAGAIAQRSADLAEQDRLRDAIQEAQKKAAQNNEELAALQNNRKKINERIEKAQEELEKKLEAEDAISEKVALANEPFNRQRAASVALAQARDRLEEIMGTNPGEDVLKQAQEDFENAQQALQLANQEATDAREAQNMAMGEAEEASGATAQARAQLQSLLELRDRLDQKIQKTEEISAATTAQLTKLENQLRTLENAETTQTAAGENSNQEAPEKGESTSKREGD
jgi:TRAP-type C4-dicarboxylate transport system permease small subunit